MLKNVTIKSRLIFVIAFLAAELVVGAVIGIYNLGVANGSTRPAPRWPNWSRA